MTSGRLWLSEYSQHGPPCEDNLYDALKLPFFFFFCYIIHTLPSLPPHAAIIHFYFGGDLNFGNFGTSIFLPELNLYLNFSSGFTDAAACSKLSGSLSRYRIFLCTEPVNFPFIEICTLPKQKWITVIHFQQSQTALLFKVPCHRSSFRGVKFIFEAERAYIMD